MSGVAIAHRPVETGQADLIGVLRAHARTKPDAVAFRLIAEERGDELLTWSALDRRARGLAVRLREMGLAGERVVLAFPHGLEFIIGFFGCLYAGCTAVPACLPTRRTSARFGSILDDSAARLVLTSSLDVGTRGRAAVLAADASGGGAGVPWLGVDSVSDALAERWVALDAPAGTPAMLQYTSGSTSEPKGVVLSHANLLASTRGIHAAFGLGDDIAVFWLPPFHDMGLVGGVIGPVFAGTTCVLMAPTEFLREPLAWLGAISRHRGTIAGGPNFAFDLCVRRTDPAQRRTLDLSSWKVAFVGAEPIQAETLERFAGAFAPCGFDPRAFYPCYGLAEATLLVSGGRRGVGAVVGTFDGGSLAKGRVEAAPSDVTSARRLVGCGGPVGDLRAVIVDPRTSKPAGAARVGEIWISGSSVARGYWRKPEQSAERFGAGLDGHGEGPFLRTGDAGFVHGGEIFVLGRLDDLIIVRGRNHHPQDIEGTARSSHPRLAAGLAAAFAIEEEGVARLILVHEVAMTIEPDLTPVLAACRESVLAVHGLSLHAILLVRSGTIPRTSSGKVQRRACREAFIKGELRSVAQFRVEQAGSGLGGTGGSREEREAGLAAPGTGSPAGDALPEGVFGAICQHALALGGAALSDLTADTSLAALGLDSLQRVELAARLEKALGCSLPDGDFGPGRTLGQLARAVQKHLDVRGPTRDQSAGVPEEHYAFNRFPEYGRLKRYERILNAVAGESPYFRVDAGGSARRGVTRVGGRELVNFCAYDYLGLARDPRVGEAAKTAVDRYGTSAGASRLVSGEKQVHRDLEGALAEFLGTPSAIAMVSGHATNVTTIGHLLGPEDLVVHDALAHNSILQGAQMSGATRRAFAHNDAGAADALLAEVRGRYRRALIAIEGVYSMDGDSPDLPRFIEIKRKHRALLLVDEAHSLGTMGATGRGIGEHWGVARGDVELWMGTLSKSLASCGGYIAGAAELVEYLAYTAPGFVYSVGMSPPNAAAALAALAALKAEPERVTRLRELAALFLSLAKERGLETGFSKGTPVIPVIVGNSIKSLRLARALFQRGINVQPILHPAVPEHEARLRFFVTTNHDEAQIRGTVLAISEELGKL